MRLSSASVVLIATIGNSPAKIVSDEEGYQTMTTHSSAGPAITSMTPTPAGLLAASASHDMDSSAHAAGTAQAPRDAAPPTAPSAIRIGLPHMDVVLSLSAEVLDRSVDHSDFPMAIASDAASVDPVMKHLFNQLNRSDGGEDGDGVYADAIRLAIAARWLRLRSRELQPDDGLQKWRLKRVMAYIDEHIGETISLADLAQTAGLSRMYFAARFRAATGLRPHDYILRRRIHRAKELLLQGNVSLVEIALDVGFQTQAHFTTVFKRFAGMTPGRWRAANRQLA